GCGPKKAGSSDDAITLAKAMETAEEKADYLITQAKAFYNSKEFQQSIDIAQYILQYVDKNSQDAKNLLEKAKEALKQKAQEAVTDVKSKIGSFGQ
nr:hypothetical protein [Candidatus Omnitrophota bacterium]